MTRVIDTPVAANPSTTSARRRSPTLRKRLAPFVAAVVILGLWQGAVWVFGIEQYLLPGPVAVVEELVGTFGSLVAPTLITLTESYIGFIAAAVIGVGIGVVLTRWRVLDEAAFPYLIIIQTIPNIAIAPLLVVWFGAGIGTNAIVAVLVSFVPVAVNTLQGLKSTDPNLIDLYRMSGTSKVVQMFSLRIPYALPQILSGLKIASGASVIGAVVGEFSAGLGGGQAGLGWVITESATQLETARVLAAVVMACAVSLILFAVVSIIERRVIGSWHASSSDGGRG